MSKAEILYLLVTYKYLLLIPIAFFEGHIISMIVGFLARLGQINPFLGGFFIVLGNLIGDVTLYWLGFHKGAGFVRRWGKYFGLNSARVEKGREIFHEHKTWILLISKLTNGLGLAMAVLFTAGMMRIRFRTYMFWNIFGECLWTASLISVGYFLGNIYTSVDNVIIKIGGVVIVFVVIFLVFINVRRLIEEKMHLSE